MAELDDNVTVVFELKRVREQDVRGDMSSLKGVDGDELWDLELRVKPKSVKEVVESADSHCREYMKLWKKHHPTQKVLGFVVVVVMDRVVVTRVEM